MKNLKELALDCNEIQEIHAMSDFSFPDLRILYLCKIGAILANNQI